MASPSLWMMMRLLVVAVLVVAAAAAGAGTGALSGLACKGDMKGLSAQCGAYVQRPGPMADPSEACCEIIKNADVPCVCEHITRAMELFLDMKKVVHVADFCGTPLAHGSKCGSFTVPFN